MPNNCFNSNNTYYIGITILTNVCIFLHDYLLRIFYFNFPEVQLYKYNFYQKPPLTRQIKNNKLIKTHIILKLKHSKLRSEFKNKPLSTCVQPVQ
jgi:hypothetical protein